MSFKIHDLLISKVPKLFESSLKVAYFHINKGNKNEPEFIDPIEVIS